MLLKLLGNMYTGESAPEIKPKLPDISKFIPKMTMPKISMPKISMPKIK